MNKADLTFSIWDSRTDPLRVIFSVIEAHYHPRPITEEWAEYKFRPQAQPTVASVAWDRDRPIGIIGASIRRFRSNSSEILGAFSLIAFVDNRYRGKKVAPRLLETLHESLSKQAVGLMIVLPNESYARALQKTGYTHIADHTTTIYPASFGSVPRLLADPVAFRTFRPLRPNAPSNDELSSFASALSFQSSRRIHTSLSEADLQHQLSISRNNHYRIDFFDDLGCITSHGMRGKVFEIRIIATAPRALSATQKRFLARCLRKKYSPDILSIRESAIAPKPISVSSGCVVLRAAPPVYVRPMFESSHDYANALTLSGIDAHTW